MCPSSIVATDLPGIRLASGALALQRLTAARAIAERIAFVILKHAHRQIHAEDAGGAAGAQDLASQANHPEITNEHFLSALLDQGEGITRPLLEKIGANVDQLRAQSAFRAGAPPENPRSRRRSAALERTPHRVGRCGERDVETEG